MNMVTLGPGGIPKVSRINGTGAGLPSRARAADLTAASVSQAVTLASVQSMQSSPMSSDRIEDITSVVDEDDKALLERQAAVFTAQFTEAGAASSAMPAPALPLHVAPVPRLQTAHPQAMAAVEAKVVELHNTMAAQGKQLSSEVAQLQHSLANTVSKVDFSTLEHID